MQTRSRKTRVDWTLLGTLGIVFLGYMLLFDLAGGRLFLHNDYDSYTLQSLAWLEGNTSLGENYSWLELAIYEGQYFVSFPPFPSVVMLPLAAVFGYNTPSNLVLVGACLCAVAFCYECLRHQGAKNRQAAFWAVFFVMGSNMVSMSLFGGVWYIAQGFNLSLVTGALWALLCRRRALCLSLLACAVGCRPFSICFLTAAFIYFAVQIFRGHESRPFLRLIGIAAIPAAIGACYMGYNYVRFGDPLEFGHSYLPEFVEAENGQFDWSYVGNNLYNIFCQPVTITETGTLDFPYFDGFMFFVANPFFLVWFFYLVRDCVKRRFHWKQGLITAALAANLFLLLLHKTFGGWQFGARYTVDLLPYALWYLMEDRIVRAPKPIVFLGIAAVMFNVYGALAMFFKMSA